MTHRWTREPARLRARAESAIISASGVALAATGTAKLLSVFGTARVLGYGGPFLLMPTRWVFGLAGALEFVVSADVCFGQRGIVKLLLVAWLSTCIAIYRGGLWFAGSSRPCGCAGSALEWLPWLDRHQEVIFGGLLGGLIAGAYWVLIARAFDAKRGGAVT